MKYLINSLDLIIIRNVGFLFGFALLSPKPIIYISLCTSFSDRKCATMLNPSKKIIRFIFCVIKIKVCMA